MAKGLPYFKFTPSEWLTGDIVFEDFELQGIFINVCALYWHRDGQLSYSELEKRIKTDRLISLTDRFISVKDGFISIDFLDEQFQERNFKSSINRENGKKGGRPKVNDSKEIKPNANRTLTELKANETNIEEEEEKNKKKNKINKPDSVSSEVWESFLKHRKNKKAPVSDKVIEMLNTQAKLAGLSLEEAISYSMFRGWIAFKADWYTKDNPTKQGMAVKSNAKEIV